MNSPVFHEKSMNTSYQGMTLLKGGRIYMTLVSVEEIQKRVSNVYEAVMLAAREARRINELRLAEKARLIEEEEPVQEQNLLGEQEQLTEEKVEEKVTVQALQRLAEGTIGTPLEPEEE